MHIEDGKLIQGKGRSILLDIMSSAVILSMVMLWSAGSQAQIVEVQRRVPVRSVPEPDTSVLLVLGIGLTSLVRYGLQYRKHKA